MIDLLSVKIQDGTVTRHNIVKELQFEFKVAENLRLEVVDAKDFEYALDAYCYQLKRMSTIVDFLKTVGLLTEKSAEKISKEIDKMYSWREEIKEHDS